jgi:hypothetical protein
MSDALGRFAAVDPANGLLSLPLWTAGAAAALLVVFCLLAFNRAGREGVIGSLARVALVMIGAGVSWAALEGGARRDVVAERRALDTRMHELLTRAAVPGSALACLDAIAGEIVEASCEKALFQTPEAMAAAVSYVSAQLTLLADFSAHARRPGAGAPPALGNLRRAIETDRFGLVARVLAVRDGCTTGACSTFALVSDTSHIVANLSEGTYDLYVARHSAVWPAIAKSPVATLAPGAPPETTAGKGNALFFPSSASIPPVNIMNTEPPVPAEPPAATAPPATRQATPPTPPRRPAQSSAPAQSGAGIPPNLRQPVDLNAAARSGPPAYAPQ